MKRSALLKRRTPLRRRAVKPKRRLSRPCAAPSCRSIHAPIVVSEAEVYCGSHGMAEADRLASLIVRDRDRSCVSCGRPSSDAAHVLGRGRIQIRWLVGDATRNPGNIVGLCRICHEHYTVNPLLWQAFIDEKWPGLWRDLTDANRFGEVRRIPVDVGDVIRRFRVRFEEAA